MPRKKKTCGPSLEAGVVFKLVPAKKKSLAALRESFKGDDRLVETMWLISPVEFAGRKAGEEFLKERASSWENKLCPYVTVRDVDNLETPKTVKLTERISREKRSLDELKAKKDAESQKVRLVTCKNCGSKINRAWIKRSSCPVCGKALQVPSTAQQIRDKKAKITKLKADLEAERRKKSDEAPLKYLVAMPKTPKAAE